MRCAAPRRALIALLLLLMPAALAESAPQPAQAQTAVVRAVGDIMMHEEQLRAHRAGDGHDFSGAFVLIRDSIAAADYAIGNLECTVGKVNGKGYSGFPAFNAPPELLDALKDAGFDMLTLANNHMLDRFLDGVAATLDNLDARRIAHVGANRTQAERDAPVIADVNGIRIGMLAYTEHTNGMERYVDPSALPYAVNLLYKADVPGDVERLRGAGAELVVACVHWGDEYVREPTDAQRRAAQKLADMGVDVIIGSHPHVAQRIDIVESEDGRRVPVAYSLGNFVAYMQDAHTDGGLIFEFTAERGRDGTVRVRDPRYVPVFLWKGAPRNGGRVVRPVPSGLLWRQPLAKMGKSDRAKMKASYRALAALLKKEPALPLDA